MKDEQKATQQLIAELVQQRTRVVELTRDHEMLQAEVEQRQQTVEELAIFRRFAEASGQAFGMADLDGRITYVNQTLFRWSDEKTPDEPNENADSTEVRRQASSCRFH